MNDWVEGMINGSSRHRSQANILKQVNNQRDFDLTLKQNLKGLNLISVPPNHTHLYMLQSQCLRTASYAPGKTQVPLSYVGRGVDFLATSEHSWLLTEVSFFSLAPACEWKRLPFALSMVRIQLYRRSYPEAK